MLVKSHLKPEYSESFGVLSEDRGMFIFMDEDPVKVSKALIGSLSPVVSMNILWLNKDLWVTCDVASSEEDRRVGLQSYKQLEDKHGLYFGYPGGADVTFHQGSVRFPLDVLFLREDEIVQIETNTRVGYDDHWSCKNCDGVIEVNAGFCNKYEVDLGDIVALFANSERDVAAYKSSMRVTKYEMAYGLQQDENYFR